MWPVSLVELSNDLPIVRTDHTVRCSLHGNMPPYLNTQNRIVSVHDQSMNTQKIPSSSFVSLFVWERVMRFASRNVFYGVSSIVETPGLERPAFASVSFHGCVFGTSRITPTPGLRKLSGLLRSYRGRRVDARTQSTRPLVHRTVHRRYVSTPKRRARNIPRHRERGGTRVCRKTPTQSMESGASWNGNRRRMGDFVGYKCQSFVWGISL